jgi:hemerythrin-like domain-containing protein
MQCIEVVTQDHMVLRRALNILDAIVVALERSEPVEFNDAQAIVQFIQVFGIEQHQPMEDMLFTKLRRKAPLDNRIQHMVFQHEEQRVVMMDIQEALTFRRGVDFVQHARLLITLYRNHFDREEAILSQIAEAALSAPEDNAVVTELTGSRKSPVDYTSYTRLGWKYLQTRTKTA